VSAILGGGDLATIGREINRLVADAVVTLQGNAKAVA